MDWLVLNAPMLVFMFVGQPRLRLENRLAAWWEAWRDDLRNAAPMTDAEGQKWRHVLVGLTLVGHYSMALGCLL